MERSDYRDKIKAGIISQPIGLVMDMEERVNPKNRDLFIEIGKELIDSGFGNADGWELEFNSFYTKYRKITFPFNPKP